MSSSWWTWDAAPAVVPGAVLFATWLILAWRREAMSPKLAAFFIVVIVLCVAACIALQGCAAGVDVDRCPALTPPAWQYIRGCLGDRYAWCPQGPYDCSMAIEAAADCQSAIEALLRCEGPRL